MALKFKVLIKNPLESFQQFETRLEETLNSFFSDINEDDEWDYTRVLGTGTDNEPGSETFILYKNIKKSNKKIGFSNAQA